ncbi:hypothetical protein L208DRAFT_1247199, partial [Tricholoma matsutake]
ISVYNVNGTPNEVGSISEVWDCILHYQNHSEHATFVVTGLGNQDIILGITWLGNSMGAGKPAVFRSRGIQVQIWCLKSSTCVIPYPYTWCCRFSWVLLSYSNLS